MFVTARFLVPFDRVQFDFTVVPVGENLPVLGIHGQDRTAHELPELVPVDKSYTLFTSDIPLERVSVPHNLQEQRVRLEKLGVW